MMHRPFLCNLLIVCCVFTSNAQKIPLWQYVDSGKVYVGISPLALMDPYDGNISLCGEYRFRPAWSVRMDAAYIFYSQYFMNTKATTGFILRPALRAYVGRYKDFFFDFQLHYKYAMYRIDDWLDREVVNGVASYQGKTRFRYLKQVIGGQITAGVKKAIGDDQRFFIELYLGLGLHYKHEHVYGEPDSEYHPRHRIIEINNNEARVLPMGVRVIYRIR